MGLLDSPYFYGYRWREPASNQPISFKSQGFLGELPIGNSKATEYSVDVDINGKPVQIPTIVPTLTQEELQHLLHIIQNGGQIPENIMQKAVSHAQQRLEENKSPFWKIPEKQTNVNSLFSLPTFNLDSLWNY